MYNLQYKNRKRTLVLKCESSKELQDELNFLETFFGYAEVSTGNLVVIEHEAGLAFIQEVRVIMDNERFKQKRDLLAKSGENYVQLENDISNFFAKYDLLYM